MCLAVYSKCREKFIVQITPGRQRFNNTELYHLASFSPKQQAKMAAYCVSIFGDMLLNKPLDDYPVSTCQFGGFAV